MPFCLENKNRFRKKLIFSFELNLENLSNYKLISFDVSISSELSENYRSLTIRSNLISPSIFNPNANILSINLQKSSFYINKTFRSNQNQIVESFIDFIIFDFVFESKRTKPTLCQDFNAVINLELLE